MFALAATETADGLACNSGGTCAYGEPADMTLVKASEDDMALLQAAAVKAVPPAYKERCGEDCAATWNATIGAALGFEIN